MKETSINKRIGEHIRKLRVGKGLSQESLAMDLDLSISTMSNHERGSTGIPIGRLYLLLELLDTTIIDFFAEVENVPRNHTAADQQNLIYSSQTNELVEEIRKIKIELETLKNRE